jgi:hypothetical protein
MKEGCHGRVSRKEGRKVAKKDDTEPRRRWEGRKEGR